jgi:hypothetical protein
MNFLRESVDSFAELLDDWLMFVWQNQLRGRILRANSPCLQRFLHLAGRVLE